jgi:hypothetical protein
MTWDEEVDRAIDVLAGRMTAGDVPASFTARVMAELHAPRPRWRAARWARSTLALAPLAAAVAIVIAALVVLPRWRASHAGPAVVRPSEGRDVALNRGPSIRPARSSPGPGPAPVQDPAASWVSAPLRSAPGLDTSGIDPLTQAPIEVDPIALDEIPRSESIQIPRLDPIESIRVTPLAEGDRP